MSTNYALKLCLSLLVFALAINQVDWGQVQDILLSAQPVWLLLHVIAMVAERLVFAWKWLVLIRVHHPGLGFAELLVTTLIGKLWGTFLPSSMGVDVVRGYYLNKSVQNLTQVAASVIADKLLALIALVIIGLLAWLVAPAHLQHPGMLLVLILSTVLLCAGLVVCASDHLMRLTRQILSAVGLPRVGDVLGKLRDAILEYRDVPARLMVSFAGSITLQFVRVVSVWCLAMALALDVPFAFLLLVVPLSMLFLMLPISIGGIGLREGVLVGMFTLVGLPAEDGFALGLAVTLSDLVLSLIGGLVYFRFQPSVSD